MNELFLSIVDDVLIIVHFLAEFFLIQHDVSILLNFFGLLILPIVSLAIFVPEKNKHNDQKYDRKPN